MITGFDKSNLNPPIFGGVVAVEGGLFVEDEKLNWVVGVELEQVIPGVNEVVGGLNWKCGIVKLVLGTSVIIKDVDDSLETTEVVLLELLPLSLPNVTTGNDVVVSPELGCRPTGDEGGAGVSRVVLLEVILVSLPEDIEVATEVELEMTGKLKTVAELWSVWDVLSGTLKCTCLFDFVGEDFLGEDKIDTRGLSAVLETSKLVESGTSEFSACEFSMLA